MPEVNVRIEKLKLRLSGVDAATARAAAAGLGEAIAAGLKPSLAGGSAEIRRMDLGVVQAPQASSASQLRQAAAGTVTKAIAQGLGQGEARS